MKKVLKVIGNIITSLLLIILVAILMLAVYTFIELDVREKEYCNIFGYSIFQIETGSMEDTLKIEDIIIVKLGNDNINKKDIITFWQDGNLVTHRLLRVEEQKYFTKGDNNPTEDEPIVKEDILGKVVFTISDVKIWKSVFKEPKVIISIVITTILFVLVIAYKEKIGETDVR